MCHRSHSLLPIQKYCSKRFHSLLHHQHFLLLYCFYHHINILALILKRKVFFPRTSPSFYCSISTYPLSSWKELFILSDQALLLQLIKTVKVTRTSVVLKLIVNSQSSAYLLTYPSLDDGRAAPSLMCSA
jgi:hypothetical protein